jgi:hypothetical protein
LESKKKLEQMVFLLVCNDPSINFDEAYVDKNLGQCKQYLKDTILVCAKMDPGVIPLFKDVLYDQRSVELRSYEVLSTTKIDRVITWREGDILYASKLRKVFKIEGQLPEKALLFRDKVAMKQKVANSIAIPAFAPVTSITDVLEFIKIHGYPVIVKPKKLLGSVGVMKVQKYEDLSSPGMAWLNIMEGIVETFVEGEMFNVDGVYQKGKILFAWPSGKLGTCLDSVNGNIFGVFQLSENNPLTSRLVNFAEATLNALEADDMCFHLECFYTKQDSIQLCEVGCRFAGAYNPDCWRMSLNLSLTDLSFQVQAGVPINVNTIPSKLTVGYLMITAKLGTLESLPTKPKNCLLFSNCAKLGQVFSPPIALSDVICWGIIKANSEEEWQILAKEDFCEIVGQLKFGSTHEKGRLAHLTALTE